MSKLVELALELLQDDHGITIDAWKVLYPMLERERSTEGKAIIAAIDGCEDRVFLPADFKLD